jgi:CubicO group peptidase (beta-lactamase class C family)
MNRSSASLRLRLLALTFAVALAAQPAMLADKLPRARPEQVGLSSDRLQRLTDALDGYVKQGKLAGAVALVARRGKVAYLEAFGDRDREARARMSDDTIFGIASQSKALVSVGVMMLQEAGALLITDPVESFPSS